MLHRKLLDNPVFKNHKLLQTFLFCLLKASHKEHEVLVGDSLVLLKEGELATGRKAISSATGLTEQNVRTALSKLEKLQILTINPTSKYSIISITNWDQYQQANQQVTSCQPTSNQQVTTNNNVNKGNNGNNDKKTYVHFDQFWELYPRKESKAPAKKIWDKLKVEDELFSKIESHLRIAYIGTEKKFIPHPTTYLNQERWQDEITTTIQPVLDPKKPTVDQSGFLPDNDYIEGELL